ncbi:Ca2+/H+ antiporter, TMEM165/GDT1 family [Marchantia polymorpha subsp. ruderalis]|uniref:GDT1 family protein n=2 Tax=Marchantia polymorpha TaxID=3197 RepID=A0A176VXN4_MARPO|nr:hypothetical protein AXG93_1964s1080 [Marchantia polymorpha subsp. ruderalis]PTQ41802.1 hypothetical protein MARPO_0032s0011 [Marchantia polymorpha]BBN11587.1 hypothetical protein Mp_5g13170 [Marchantia polymorpha subsp. ruderalis]|eukprot:PTQ41802.1 hypothetical protein MARPO_0032s0011 [Marchantia polymorpha]
MASLGALARAPSCPCLAAPQRSDAAACAASAGGVRVCAIPVLSRCGAGASARRQHSSWKKNSAAPTGLGLWTGYSSSFLSSRSLRTKNRRIIRGQADVEVEQIGEAVRRTRLNSIDRLEESMLRGSKLSLSHVDNKSDIVVRDSFSGDNYRPWIRRGRESMLDLFQQLVATLTDGDRLSTIVKFAVIASIFGLQACSPAWATTEIAKASADSSFFGDLDDIQNGFASSFLLIFFSEIGDKTFFIAALLATRKPGAAVFSGTFGALAVMTVISVVLGRAFHYVDELLPSLGETRIPWDDLAAVVLLVYFGVSTLIEAASMEESKQEGEQQEAELAIAGVGANGAVAGTVAATFALVFVAEWGDKSFFSTIALAAASSPLGVVTGAIGGHGAATLLAVLGGSFLGNYISEKVIAYVGGALFLVFAGITLVESLN